MVPRALIPSFSDVKVTSNPSNWLTGSPLSNTSLPRTGCLDPHPASDSTPRPTTTTSPHRARRQPRPMALALRLVVGRDHLTVLAVGQAPQVDRVDAPPDVPDRPVAHGEQDDTAVRAPEHVGVAGTGVVGVAGQREAGPGHPLGRVVVHP